MIYDRGQTMFERNVQFKLFGGSLTLFGLGWGWGYTQWGNKNDDGGDDDGGDGSKNGGNDDDN